MARLLLLSLLGFVGAVILGLPVAVHAQNGPFPGPNDGGSFQGPRRDSPPPPPGTEGANGWQPAGVFQPAEIIAFVDGHPVLAGDLLGTINQMLAPYVGKVPPEEIEKQRKLLMQQMLPVLIETKLAYLDLLRNVPPERVPDVHKQIGKQFDKHRLPGLMKQAKVSTAVKLDAKLRSFGSSLEKQKKIFIEQFLAQQQLRQEVDFEPEVTHREMQTYYRQHLDDYAITATARWEKLTVRIDKFPNLVEARRALAGMGNEVLRGAPLAAVAKRHSQGFNAARGGLHDWTTQGSLASKVLDDAIFTLPEGRLSRIIEDKQGFHIVRVIERRQADRVSFIEAQVKIKQRLIKDKVQAARIVFADQLLKNAKIWTIFDKQAQDRRPPRR